MKITLDYKIKLSNKEREDILKLLNKITVKDSQNHFRMWDIMYDIFYITQNFTGEYAEMWVKTVSMLNQKLKENNELIFTQEEISKSLEVLDMLVDILTNDTALPDLGIKDTDASLCTFVQLLHGVDSNQIKHNINEISNDEILDDIEYFKSIKDSVIYVHNKIKSLYNIEEYNLSSILVRKEDRDDFQKEIEKLECIFG